MSHTATCLCKAVTISYESADKNFGVCHCDMCRKWSGNAYLGAQVTNATFSPEEAVTSYESSEWANRGFCSACGTHLYYFLKPNNQYVVPLGLISDSSDFVMNHQLFIDEKPTYYDLANDCRKMTGEEAFAEFSNS